MERTRTGHAKLIVLVTIAFAFVLLFAWRPGAGPWQWVRSSNLPVQDEALAELVLFGEDLPIARRAGFEVKLTMLVGVGELAQPNEDYEFLMQAAESGEPFSASQITALATAFTLAYDNSGQAAAGAAATNLNSRWISSSFVVSSADTQSHSTRVGVPSFNPPANVQASASADTRVISSEHLLAGVRIYGAEMTYDEFRDATWDSGIASPKISPLGAPAGYIRDGEAFAGVGRYHHRSLGMPVAIVTVVECRRVEVEDLFVVLIECDADSELARKLSAIAPDAPMTRLSRHRRGVSEQVLRAHAEDRMKVLSRSSMRGVGSITGSMHTQVFYNFDGHPVRLAFPGGIDEPALSLDLGFGGGPVVVDAPRPSRPNRDINGRRIPSDNGDLRVLLTGTEGDRFRAILCLQVASYTDD